MRRSRLLISAGLAASVALACGGTAERPATGDSDSVTAERPASGATDSLPTRPRSSDSAVTMPTRDTAPSPPPPAADPDTARGLIAVVGADPMTRVTVRTADGRSLTLAGTSTASLSRLSGIEVWVSGTRTDNELTTRRFVVRAVDGVPAADGQLVERRGSLALERADGTTLALASPPAALRAHIGKRVWVTRSPAGEVHSFGVIEPPGFE